VHISCHRDLLGRPTVAHEPPADGDTVDAVVVPTCRRPVPKRIQHAARLALKTDASLVVLCSQDASSREVNAHLAGFPRDRLAVVDLPSEYEFPFVGLRTHATGWRQLAGTADTGLKRTIGLALSRLVGWTRVVFLDDDVRGVQCPDLHALLRELNDDDEPCDVAGWAFVANKRGHRTGASDNSVMCHAYRLTGGAQCTFMGAGLIAVRTDRDLPFFPMTFNEDWVFFLEAMLRGSGRVRLIGDHTQDAFDPFDDPMRAVRQEFGDVLGEGLYRNLRESRERNPPMDARDYWDEVSSPAYWSRMITLRRTFAQLLEIRLMKFLTEARTRHDIVMAHKAMAAMASVRAAMAIVDPNWPEHLASFVREWRADMGDWQRWWQRAPGPLPLDRALQSLRLAPLHRAPVASARTSWLASPAPAAPLSGTGLLR
jgi:hypothetical protein